MTRTFPESAPNIAALGAAIADPTRAMICTVLLDGRAWTPTELARSLGVALSSVSEHVSILIDRGVLTERRQGRHRYVQVASTDIADWLELTGVLAGDERATPPSLSAATRDRHLLEARTCYRHLAGDLGVRLFAALSLRGWIDETVAVTEGGSNGLAEEWGIKVPDPGTSSRPVVRRCLDWTERRSHLGGWLGDELCRTFVDREWIIRRRGSRAVRITATGRERLDWVLAVERNHR
jgi:DNA-binding transcriptional ArsR family regulator